MANRQRRAERHGIVSDQPAVSVVLIFLDGERFIEEAIASVFAQTFDAWELVLVDDGSTDRSTEIAKKYAERHPERVRYLEHEAHVNRGMSPSRNLGIAHARGRLIGFVDADDVWSPSKLQEQVALLDAVPRAAAVYGTPVYWQTWDAGGDRHDHVPGLGFAGDRLFEPPELLFTTAPLGEGPVPCPSDILVRRDAIERVGGFEPRFRGAYEDVAFFVKLFLHEPVFPTTHCWTRYRLHPESCMAVAVRTGRYHAIRLFFLNWFEEYLARRGLAGTETWARLQRTLAPYRAALAAIAMPQPAHLKASPNPVPVDSNVTTVSWTTGNGAIGQVWISQDGGHETLFAEGASGAEQAAWINAGTTYVFRLYADTARSQLLGSVTVCRLVDPGVGGESFGSLRRVIPLSTTFGFDRGQPIDRYYIERFLERYARDIRGRVLEIGEPTYTRRFGGAAVSRIDVLHVAEGNPEATIVDDLAAGTRIPSATFDCVLLIQTLHLIFDVRAALQTIYRSLTPGGVVLATFPGLSPISRDVWRESWYWGFTELSARRLFTERFPEGGVTIETSGNVLTTTAFLYGLAASELTRDELSYVDQSYQTLIAIRAMKPQSKT